MQYVMQTIIWFLKSTLSFMKIFQFFTEMIQMNFLSYQNTKNGNGEIEFHGIEIS